MREPDECSKKVRYAVWRVPTTGKGADSRVVVTDNCRVACHSGPLTLMIRAEKLPAADAPGLIEAIESAAAWIRTTQTDHTPPKGIPK